MKAIALAATGFAGLVAVILFILWRMRRDTEPKRADTFRRTGTILAAFAVVLGIGVAFLPE